MAQPRLKGGSVGGVFLESADEVINLCLEDDDDDDSHDHMLIAVAERVEGDIDHKPILVTAGTMLNLNHRVLLSHCKYMYIIATRLRHVCPVSCCVL